MFNLMMPSGACFGGLFMGVFWFLVIMAGITLYKFLSTKQNREEV